ncbi:hypothetical protein D5E69_23330 (plasmid) [Rossellomorea marisflavi]|uniref:GIY-YIG nuclease family protein n=1 Tax=Rossellomorea marisflavi TaxID=189381 RepID=UPI001317C67B|nr:GIY-YIG nuclease family protein [Rossellomorea marisflavi]QHA38766.1 hypothetical protein D5E69_23330 [Rossellomorea marisflavi]
MNNQRKGALLMGLKTTRKSFTSWELKFSDKVLSFDEIWELGKESQRIHNQDLIGIYRIKNVFSNKVYVGSSHHIFGRLRSHATQMQLGKHPYDEINKDFKLFGKESFIFDIITYCNNSQLRSFEKSWLKVFYEESQLYNAKEYINWNKPSGRWRR